MSEIVDTIVRMLRENGTGLYGGEAVTQTQHALQCGALAEAEGAPPALVTASLLHDVGHLLEDDFEHSASGRANAFHEDLGEAFLSAWFGPDVTRPVKLHVAAKRYLCATSPDYHSKLSAQSRHTLELQGGPMSAEEVSAFEGDPRHLDAIRLRMWDDLAKDPAAETPGIEHFIGYITQSLRRPGQ